MKRIATLMADPFQSLRSKRMADVDGRGDLVSGMGNAQLNNSVAPPGLPPHFVRPCEPAETFHLDHSAGGGELGVSSDMAAPHRRGRVTQASTAGSLGSSLKGAIVSRLMYLPR